MQLSFLGNSYNRKAHTLEMTESEITGRFLGKTYPMRRPIHAMSARSSQNRKYRGINY
ncbi:DUF4278 domain-containing protein [Lusitaniella coriacea]|uniref:DUF4278 domain-containing protein n=1 Tax=Lusitaniella coriacea TaxID=1983105 RepID=UPI003CF2E3AD